MKIKKTIYKISFALYAIILIAISQYAYTQPEPLNKQALDMLNAQTAPNSFSFVVIGDYRPDGMLSPIEDFNSEFADMLLDIANLNQTQPISFVINTGDVVMNGFGVGMLYDIFYNNISQWMDSYSIPFFTVPVNHEFWGSNSFTYSLT